MVATDNPQAVMAKARAWSYRRLIEDDQATTVLDGEKRRQLEAMDFHFKVPAGGHENDLEAFRVIDSLDAQIAVLETIEQSMPRPSPGHKEAQTNLMNARLRRHAWVRKLTPAVASAWESM